MDPQRWQRLEALFEAAQALPREPRDACVARESAGDAELPLLAAEQTADNPLDRLPSLVRGALALGGPPNLKSPLLRFLHASGNAGVRISAGILFLRLAARPGRASPALHLV